MVHRRDDRSAALEKRGVEVVIADLYDPDQITDAMRGMQRAYFLPLIEPFMIQSAVAFCLAAREAKLEHVVQMSQWTSHRSHPTAMTQQTWLVDHLFATIPGVAHTVFNPGMFAHNFLRTVDFAALLAIYPVLSGDGRAAPVSNEDMGRVAAVLLAEGPARHAGRSYRPTGPQLLTGREMAAIVARAVGHRVVAVNMPFWLLGKVARQQGIDPYSIQVLRHYMEDMKKGTFSFEGGVTNVVEELTGTPAETFETTARRYAALPFARQTLYAPNDVNHLGTLGTGNHFIEVCLDQADHVWFMLHSGSRGVGNRIGSYFIELAKQDMHDQLGSLPDKDLAYLREGTAHFADYVDAVS